MTYLIAIVEDDADQRRNYCAAIENKGFETAAYPNRSAALEGIKQRQPDLAVLDIILESEVDGGFMLCRDLLALNPDLPIIFLTERVDEIDKISGFAIGSMGLSTKAYQRYFFGGTRSIATALERNSLRPGKQSEHPALR